jgi:hypothetical protein
MPERAFATQSKRGLTVFMTEEDDAAFMELLRQNFSRLAIVCVDFSEEKLEIRDSLPPAVFGTSVFITNPDPGEELLDRLQTALLLSGKRESQIFRSSLPRRHANYIQSHHVHRGTIKGWDQPVECLDEGFFHFTYDRTDPEAHRFANKMLRLLKKMLVNRFAVVDAETGRVVHENWPIHGRWAAPGALESCRRHPHRYLAVGPMRDEDTHLFFAPMPPDAYAKQRTRKTRGARAARQSAVTDENHEIKATSPASCVRRG